MTDATELTRRTVLTIGGTGALGGALVLTGCAADGSTPTETDATASTTPPASADAAPSTEPGADAGAGAGAAGIAALSEVPVGGSIAVEIDGEPALLAQPEAGRVVAYSAICTHQQCVVAAAGDVFECPCHGSVFEAATGNVMQGPALDPLNPIEVRVEGDQVVAGS
ncbi:Rieske 2Fe-2S domain-containing protein [Agromyces sp. CFH 90414]|uniref:Cytochrome bc1 complex Rieske iron-sulfur subunit n=1 Tax=Agromyces agglutinans TaxID=2662258 RepID=A0A6I2F353_9MICO|nr:Rieske (2Fe-2S) protein [Agromyces agglutinans]MRG58631.1 Rieske 2Fe-2S domain-containing protein [Agromyces agglutinans]